jgi:hypothetical protein
MSPATIHMVEDGEIKNLNIFIRGNPERKGEVAERSLPRILCDSEPKPFHDGSGRKELAEAIANANNPLTARVFVNRVWGAFFGRPIVPSPSNFGHSGQLPSNPELLDDVAVRFMQDGWSVKSLVREIVLSSTYKQSSTISAESKEALRIDPENLMLWRMNRKRLSVEEWRDSVLFTSNELSDKGGKSLELDNPENFRRTVYGRVSRLKLNDTLMQFDYPDANVHAEKRAVTTTPIQKLFMLNSPFVLARATALANRLKDCGGCEERVDRAYRMLFGRQPEAWELQAAKEYMSKPAHSGMSRLEEFAQVLFDSNEFLYVD